MAPIAARILWPALGFPAVIAPRAAPQGPAGAQHSICVLLLSDRPALTAEDAARHLRIVPWGERARRQAAPSFAAGELSVRSGAALERPHRDDRASVVAFGGDRYEACIVASLSRAVRDFYARQDLRHLHEIRVSERASGRLADGQYHLLWTASATTGPSDEMRMLVDRFAVPRRARLRADTEAERRWLQRWRGFLIDEYRCDYGALHPPYQQRDPQRRFTEVLHPVFVRREPGSLKLAHLTDTHVDVRWDVYEENLRRPPPGSQMWTAPGGQLFYEGVPVQFNNENRSFAANYEDAKRDARAILITGDLIDYGRGHVGLINNGLHRHELGLDHRYHMDRNWFLFYYLLASGERYTQPVYTSLGNHDWRLNPYPPFAPGAPDPTALIHNHKRFESEARRGSLKRIIEIAHGPGHDKKLIYPIIDVATVGRAAVHYAAGNLDIPGSPLHTTTESVIWYLLLINPFLDYAFTHPGRQQVLMLDWAEDEKLFDYDEPRTWRGFGERPANSLSPLQKWQVESFVRSPGRSKVIGIHAPVLGPFPNWNEQDLYAGMKAYKRSEDSRMRWPDGRITRVDRHPLRAIRQPREPFGVSAHHGAIVRERDWFIRRVGTSDSGVRMVLTGHIHRFNLLAADPRPLAIKSLTVDEVNGAGTGRASRLRNLPAPVYLNTTCAGPRGNAYSAEWRSVNPGWSLVTLAPEGTIESVSRRQTQVPPPVLPPPRREVARFLQQSRA